MKSVVVDTNLLVVANDRIKHPGSPKCIIACIRALREVIENGRICLDDKRRMFDQYKRYASFSGDPGAGDAFFRWAFDNQANDDLCERVVINPRGRTKTIFTNFQTTPILSSLIGETAFSSR